MAEIHTDNPFGRVSRIALSASNRDGKTILDDVSFTAPYKIMTPFQNTLVDETLKEMGESTWLS